MKTKWLIAIISVSLIYCSKSQNSEVSTEVAIEELKLSEIVHDSLTANQLKDVRRIHHVFSEVSSSSLEETINNFKRDQNPDKEIAIWLKMADAYERFAVGKHVEEHDKKEEAFELILLRSMMSEEDVLNKMAITNLSKAEVAEIFSYYTDSPRPIRIQAK